MQWKRARAEHANLNEPKPDLFVFFRVKHKPNTIIHERELLCVPDKRVMFDVLICQINLQNILEIRNVYGDFDLNRKWFVIYCVLNYRERS